MLGKVLFAFFMYRHVSQNLTVGDVVLKSCSEEKKGTIEGSTSIGTGEKAKNKKKIIWKMFIIYL